MTSLRCLLLPILLCIIGPVISFEEECQIGADGSCTSESCVDEHEKCSIWMSQGECDANPNYMLRSCRKSCETCNIIDEMELSALIARKLALYEVGGDESLLETPYGITQIIDESSKSQIMEVISNFTSYMENIVFKDPSYKDVKKTCRNREGNCAFWASLGECENNPNYMTKYCAPSCGTCHQLDFKFRCPLNTSEPEALQPGDLHKMFERIVGDEYYQQFEPAILSMPNPSAGQKESGIVDGPWVVVLDKFLLPEECDRLIDLGATEGYVESADVGKKNFDGTYDKSINIGRTSTNAWCQGVCYEDEMARNVTARIENVTGIPEANSEYLQLLRYEPGQYYNTHHDYIPHQIDRQMGVRTLTVFLYLNDVDAGGGTEFPNLGLTVQPKKGRALIWPSVFNENPNAKDQRTEHGALPVEKGIKYGANAWLHQRDIKAVMTAGCT